MVGDDKRAPTLEEVLEVVRQRRRELVRHGALVACHRVGLYLHIQDAESPQFLDRRCEELVKAARSACPIAPPYANTLMAFRNRYLGLLAGYGYKNARVRLQRLCSDKWTWRTWCEYHISRTYWLLLLTAMAIGAPGAVEAQGVFYAEHEPGIGLTTELAGGPGFDETLIVDLYFYARARGDSDLMTEVIHPGNRSKRTRVFAVDRGTGPAGAAVERCRVVERASVCHALDPPASIRIGGCGDGARRPEPTPGNCWGERVEIELPPVDVDWGGEFLRLILPEGAFTLKGCACREIGGPLTVKTDEAGNPVARASPGLVVPLPAPSELERQYLEQRPFLRFDVSPFTRDQSDGDGGFHDLSMSFDGGVYRQQARGRWLAQAKWSGDIATKAGLNFNHLSVEAGAALNLIKGDWLPLTLGARGQSDQSLDAFDLSAEARLAYVLPFNLSLQSGDYRPATAPLVNVMAAYGAGLVRSDGVGEASFLRAGYEAWWRVPVADNLLLNVHHAGVWNRPDGVGGEFHALWDVAAEVAVGGVSYLVGYQKGGAAPLFLPIETTRAGLSFAVGR